MNQSQSESSASQGADALDGSESEASRHEEPRQPSRPRQAADDAAQLQESIEAHYEELEEQYDELRAVLDDYNRSAREFIRNHPGMCIAGALGFGYMVGRLASRRWLK